MENAGVSANTENAVETVWIVQKMDWKYNDMWYSLSDDIPLKAFTDRSQAQKYCDALNAEEQDLLVRETDVTFHFGGLSRMTTLSQDELMRRISDAGIKAFLTFQNVHSPTWWKRVWKTLSPERRAWLWSLFDLIQFYEVVEVELLP